MQEVSSLPKQCELSYRQCTLPLRVSGFDGFIFRKGQYLVRGRSRSKRNSTQHAPIIWFAPFRVISDAYMKRSAIGENGRKMQTFSYRDCMAFRAKKNLTLFAFNRRNLSLLKYDYPALRNVYRNTIFDHDDVLVYHTGGYVTPENREKRVYRSMRFALSLAEVLQPLGFDGWIVHDKDAVRLNGGRFHPEICLFPGFPDVIELVGMCDPAGKVHAYGRFSPQELSTMLELNLPA